MEDGTVVLSSDKYYPKLLTLDYLRQTTETAVHN